MTLLHYPMITTLLITIDRIEGEYAVLEWEDLSLSSMHQSLFSFVPEEGMRIELSFYPSPIGDSYAITSDPSILLAAHPIVIPLPNLVVPGLHYSYRIVEKPWAYEP